MTVSLVKKRPRVGDCDVICAPDALKPINEAGIIKSKFILSENERNIIKSNQWLSDESMTLDKLYFDETVSKFKWFTIAFVSSSQE